MSLRTVRLQVVVAVSLSVAGIVAACDDTFPNQLTVYDGDAAVVDTGAPATGEAGADSGGQDAGGVDASDAGHATDGGDAGHTTDGGDAGEHDGSADASTDAKFDAE